MVCFEFSKHIYTIFYNINYIIITSILLPSLFVLACGMTAIEAESE
jgi:hypothetical protein